ncbi:Protein of unknown function [Prosthecobacter debontii]|uniref:Tll0287-like domain-containing protein n=1 Tax=Prosthecobacter debontii TaxID=48467 RepID=A0A1T4YR95_9BACT|nr:DUF3365 domain-containing protein [Prosthecobacter debontii]SKB04256.1 Protein of unknown function [Prosthecobacter debontii]
MKTSSTSILALAAIIGLLSSCGGKSETGSAGGISPQQMADALHAVMESDRTVYTKAVVNRLQNEEKVIKASEHWQDDKALPLPAQMFRMGAEMVAGKKKGFTYALLSEWPINKQNSPKTDAEKTGLAHIVKNVGQNYYTEETLGGKKYFTAVYPDIAIAAACVKCHNGHDDSPRTDFKEGDVMGGVVIRIPLTASN